MRFVAANEVKAGDLTVSMDRVTRLTQDANPVDGQVRLIGYNNRNGFAETSTVNAAAPVLLDEPVQHRLPNGSTIEVELAGVKNERDPDSSWVYRHRIFDTDGRKLTDDLGPNGPADERSPDNQKAFESLVSFLGAAAEAQDTIDRGDESENVDLFDQDVRQWAQRNSDELQMLGLEFESVDLSSSKGLE